MEPAPAAQHRLSRHEGRFPGQTCIRRDTMNRRNVISLSAATALGLAFLSGSAIAQQKSLKDQLVGTWTVAAWEQTNKDGSKLHRFGANPKGVNVFNADG